MKGGIKHFMPHLFWHQLLLVPEYFFYLIRMVEQHERGDAKEEQHQRATDMERDSAHRRLVIMMADQ